MAKSTISKADAKNLRPSLDSFQDERVQPQDLSKTSCHFFGKQFFKDDWFPSWLTGRNDFLTFCPRYCPDEGVFDQIADDIPRTYMVVRAMKKSNWGDKMDMAQIRHLARKACVMEFPRGTTIFHQGDVADALYIVVKGSVSLRIKQNAGGDKSDDSGLGARLDNKLERMERQTKVGTSSMNFAMLAKKAEKGNKLPDPGPGSPKSPGSPTSARSVRELEVAVAKEADVFGEVGLEAMSTKSGESRRRAATAYCQEATIVARIPAEAYKVELKAIQQDSTRQLCEWFESGACELINHLSKHGQIMLAKKVKSEMFAPDTTIYKEGDAAHAIFLVRRGHCVAKKTLDFKQQIRSDVNGIESKGLKFSKEAALIEFKEGDYFGEEFLVDRKERAMRVVATRGGADLIVVLNSVADELFKVESLPAVLERWQDVMSKVHKNQASCLANIQSQQLRRNVRLDCFGPWYQRRAHMVSDRCMDTVQQILDEDSQRRDYLKQAYESCSGQINVAEVSVKELKRKEEGGKRRAQVARREAENAEERRCSLMPSKVAADGLDEGPTGQTDTVWLRKERRKLLAAADLETLEDKEEKHEEICDDVRHHFEQVAEEGEERFRRCCKAFDKQVEFRKAKEALLQKQQQHSSTEEPEELEGPEDEIMDDLISEESEDSEGSFQVK
jgi:CRP-like cAMP-binding protein